METETHRGRGRRKPALRCTPYGVTASLRGVRRCRWSSKLSTAMKPDPKDPLAAWADHLARSGRGHAVPCALFERALGDDGLNDKGDMPTRPMSVVMPYDAELIAA